MSNSGLSICRITTSFVILSECSESKDLRIIAVAVHFSGAKIPPLRYASVGMTGAVENLKLPDKLEFGEWYTQHIVEQNLILLIERKYVENFVKNAEKVVDKR